MLHAGVQIEGHVLDALGSQEIGDLLHEGVGDVLVRRAVEHPKRHTRECRMTSKARRGPSG